MELDNRRIDHLAHSYALQYATKGGDEEKQRQTFHDLAQLVRPSIMRKASREVRSNPHIPREDFISEFLEALFRAAKNYNGEIRFMARFNIFMNQAAVNTIRHHNYMKRSHRDDSMDKLVFYENDPEDECVSYYDTIPSQESVEEEVLALEIKKTLADYATVNERNARIIEMVIQGCTNLEIAKSIGANQYDARTRKVVQRAKEGFKAFLA